MSRYGDRFTVNGTADFSAQIIRSAVDSEFSVTFADPAMEWERLARIATEVTGMPNVKRPGGATVSQTPSPQRWNGLCTLS
ncbi:MULTISPECIES: hypothetical protein [Burkholderiaceae]|uniref:LPD7 domain-containing protein n=1 Tax=Burkholderiaceae TaxID=119060 RepID=UPI000977BFC7|nr:MULTISPECIES: hypothetical protein [Burkholderiaceae]MCF2133738.1 hypothetical protein [Mycetohabitans sp. B3]MCG1039293.1 hypothetical protein [Mycetohabitans sp. B7]